MVLHLSQEEEQQQQKNPLTLSSVVVVCLFLTSYCHSLLGLFVYILLSPSGQGALGGEERV